MTLEKLLKMMENTDSEDEPRTESRLLTTETWDLQEEDQPMSWDALMLPQ